MSMSRRYTVSVATGWMPHYNHSVGRYVRTRGEFLDALRSASEKQSERTGVEHNYQPVELGEVQGVTEEGMDATRRAHFKA